MCDSQDSQASSKDIVENTCPHAGQDFLNPCSVSRMPRGEHYFMRDFILCSTAQRLQKYGEGMIEEQREFLLTSLEYLASLT